MGRQNAATKTAEAGADIETIGHWEYFACFEDKTPVNCRRCCLWAGAFQVIGRAARLKGYGRPTPGLSAGRLTD